jgi:hypothetical protein
VQCTTQGGRWNRNNTCGFCNQQVQAALGACCSIASPSTCTHVTQRACRSNLRSGVRGVLSKRWSRGARCADVCSMRATNTTTPTAVGVAWVAGIA